ncbi:MAG: ATP synthase F1 subunit gamma [Ignavibacteria bacterium RBG_13_36_8]|nr:MAG: ATP synthase F1 subunit gamma [Ignavibacteria bacterium RBG_13_36_8]
MATLRDIKRRIVGIKSTQQITKAMKMVAAVRLRRAQERIINARPYSKRIAEMLGHLLSIENNFSNAILEKRDVGKVAIIVLTSDRGLCGAFNMNIIRLVEDLIYTEYSEFHKSGNLFLYCIGKKGFDYFSKRNFNIIENHTGILSNLEFDFAVKFISEVKHKFVNKEFDKVIVVYNEFKSVIQQKIKVEQVLPLNFDYFDEIDNTKFIDYIFEPNREDIINTLLPKHINAQVWRILLESYAAELGARMTAMDMATENAKEMIRSLQLTYNKERQASITTELLEIVSGANALKESS